MSGKRQVFPDIRDCYIDWTIREPSSSKPRDRKRAGPNHRSLSHPAFLCLSQSLLCSASSDGFKVSMIQLHVFFLLLWLAEAFESPGFNDRHQTNGAEPWFAEKASNMTVAEGRTASLPCVVEHLGKHKLAWIHKDRHILLTLHDKVITRNPRVSVHHSNHRSWSLEIRDVKPEDSGFYMCQINTNPMISQTRHLEVVVPPSIDEKYTSSDTSIREGADVSLQCRATGSPQPDIKWTREEQKDIILGQKRVRMLEGEYLNLTRASRLSMGAYLCIASNGVQPSVSKRIMLNVLFAPMILIPSQLIGASLGEDVTLVCNLESFPRSVTYWVIAGGIVIVTNNKYRVLSEPSDPPAAYKVKLKLLIRDLRPQDFGSYTCVARNSIGDTEGTIVLYEKPSLGTTEAEPTERIEPSIKKNEVLYEEIRPIADNIKLERKERREETERQDFPTYTHPIDIPENYHPPDTPNSSPSLKQTIVMLGANSAYLLVRRFVANG